MLPIIDSLKPGRLFRAFFNYIFPYVTHDTVTQSYVWRLGLENQRRLARSYRAGQLGHYYEFGVYAMTSISKFNFIRKRAGRRDDAIARMKIFAFDSFEGMPPAAAGDVPDPAWKQGALRCTLEDVRELARRHKVDNITFIKGYFENSLTAELARQLSQSPPSLVHIDCDLYSSTITVLRWLDPLALPGAIYFFDDIWRYYGHPDAGELKAIAEYNHDPAMRGMLVEHPLGLGSKQVYCFCPRNPNEAVEYLAASLETQRK
jgi:O-methyltransferase